MEEDESCFTNRSAAASLSGFMEKFFSIFSFPIGLTICFGPVLAVWLKEEFKQAKDKRK